MIIGFLARENILSVYLEQTHKTIIAHCLPACKNHGALLRFPILQETLIVVTLNAFHRLSKQITHE